MDLMARNLLLHSVRCDMIKVLWWEDVNSLLREDERAIFKLLNGDCRVRQEHVVTNQSRFSRKMCKAFFVIILLLVLYRIYIALTDCTVLYKIKVIKQLQYNYRKED